MKSAITFTLALVACLQVAQAAPAVEGRAATAPKYLCNLPPGDPGELRYQRRPTCWPKASLLNLTFFRPQPGAAGNAQPLGSMSLQPRHAFHTLSLPATTASSSQSTARAVLPRVPRDLPLANSLASGTLSDENGTVRRNTDDETRVKLFLNGF